jgi:hypothetical protein
MIVCKRPAGLAGVIAQGGGDAGVAGQPQDADGKVAQVGHDAWPVAASGSLFSPPVALLAGLACNEDLPPAPPMRPVALQAIAKGWAGDAQRCSRVADARHV